MNVSFNVGDGSQNVLENRQRIKEAFGVSRLVSANQVHGNNILFISQQPSSDVEEQGYDAIISAAKGVAFMIQQADCQAVFLYDPVRHAAGIIHAGWRGSVQNIIGDTVRAMKENLGVKPANLYAAVSPSLGPCCAEFINYQKELPQMFKKYRVRENNFDFWSISRDQLVNASVKPEKIDIAGICNLCNPDFYSFRREGITGRFASVIGLY